jgi:hypothetical protein
LQRDIEEGTMPSTSKQTSPGSVNLLGVERRYQVLDGHTVSFETYHRDIDTAHLFRGLPDDSCQSPHWGLVQTGRVIFRYGDHDEVVAAGQAYYARPGHTALIDAGTELVQFSPNGPLAEARDASVGNLVAALSDPASIATATVDGRAA